MKKNILPVSAFLLFAIHSASTACEVCERNQPKLLRGVVHGSGPDSNYDYISIGITILITVFTLFYSVKWLMKPGERNADHIKYTILN